MSKKALGRGLSALLPAATPQQETPAPVQAQHHNASTEAPVFINGVVQIPLQLIHSNPLQPRKHFDEESLSELAESIKIHGVVQPVVVNKVSEGYRLVIGERRFRASKLAGLDCIPALIREYADQQLLEIALIENIQREDLNPIEEAKAFSYLLREHNLTHEELASRLGCSRPSVTNSLRLLTLPDSIIDDLAAGVLRPGHARAVLSFDDPTKQLEIWKYLKDNNLSVRQAEKYVSMLQSQAGKEKPAKQEKPKLPPDWEALVDKLRVRLNADIHVNTKANGKGQIEFRYTNHEELVDLMEMFVYFGEMGKRS